MTEVLTPTGVYALCRQGEVVYIGKSLNVFARLSKHYTNMRRVQEGKPSYGQSEGPPIIFDDCWVQWAHYDKLDQLEIQLIRQFNPIHNKQLNRPRVEIAHLPAFAEMLERAKAGKEVVIMRRPLRPTTAARVVSTYKRYERRLVRTS